MPKRRYDNKAFLGAGHRNNFDPLLGFFNVPSMLGARWLLHFTPIEIQPLWLGFDTAFLRSPAQCESHYATMASISSFWWKKKCGEPKWSLNKNTALMALIVLMAIHTFMWFTKPCRAVTALTTRKCFISSCFSPRRKQLKYFKAEIIL